MTIMMVIADAKNRVEAAFDPAQRDAIRATTPTGVASPILRLIKLVREAHAEGYAAAGRNEKVAHDKGFDAGHDRGSAIARMEAEESFEHRYAMRLQQDFEAYQRIADLIQRAGHR